MAQERYAARPRLRNWLAIIASMACMPSLAQQNPSCFKNCNTEIFFGNGVWAKSNDGQDAYDDLKSIQKALMASGDAQFANGFDTDIAWNPSVSRLDDIIESVAQRADIPDYLRILYRLNPPDPAILPIAILLELAVESLSEARNNTAAVTQAQLDKYRAAIGAGKKVVVIAHSQGNLFVNDAYGYLSPTERKSFGIVAVASPADYVAGEDRFAPLDSHVTDNYDAVINGVRAIFPSTLDGNIPDNRYTVADSYGHIFGNHYFLPGNHSREKIVQLTGSVLKLLQSSPTATRFGSFTGTVMAFTMTDPTAVPGLHIGSQISGRFQYTPSDAIYAGGDGRTIVYYAFRDSSPSFQLSIGSQQLRAPAPGFLSLTLFYDYLSSGQFNGYRLDTDFSTGVLNFLQMSDVAPEGTHPATVVTSLDASTTINAGNATTLLGRYATADSKVDITYAIDPASFNLSLAAP